MFMLHEHTLIVRWNYIKLGFSYAIRPGTSTFGQTCSSGGEQPILRPPAELDKLNHGKMSRETMPIAEDSLDSSLSAAIATFTFKHVDPV